MKIRGVLKPFLMSVALIPSVNAAPITYDFSMSGFQGAFGSLRQAPLNSIAGSFTLDGNIVTDINLTIGSTVYSAPMVAYAAGYPDLIGGAGGFLHQQWSMDFGTNDFWLQGDFKQGYISSFNYSFEGISDSTFVAYNGAIVARPSAVPLPGTLMFFASSIATLFFRRHFSPANY